MVAVEQDVAEAFPQARCRIASEIENRVRTVGMGETVVGSKSKGKQCRIRSIDPEPFSFELSAPSGGNAGGDFAGAGSGKPAITPVGMFPGGPGLLGDDDTR